ncbi:MAG: quinoprotein dehydrogenase-associated putative ABC transporter substrate-binding protein [Proteobacteria bacterium]|nr:MAG: quinoprotein dehydrogenase-associated putative ABC transporter substrate-binding protein [Pseudomonadota bacterium]
MKRRPLAGAALAAFATLAALGPARAVAAEAAKPARTLRVCADPNNMPFSNERREGMENALAELVARELGATVEYTWLPQRRGFVRNTLGAQLCDVMMSAPTSFERVLTTAPYYRSTYVFVQRAGAEPIRSFDDPALRTLRVAVQLVGDDGWNTPPAHALAKRGIVANVRGYTLYGDYAQPDPPARIVDAVARGDVDVAVAWGPLAGWFATREPVPLALTPVSPQIDLPFLPFVFDIAMGVRRGDERLRDELDGVIERRRAEIDALLARYGVPRVDR